VIRIELWKLYYAIGRPKKTACEMLQTLLDMYDVEYELLANLWADLPVDEGKDVYLTDDEEFIEKYEKALTPEKAKKVLREYEKKRRGVIIELLDGKEMCIAIVFPKTKQKEREA
jgi:hypothetical protein